MKKVTLVVPVYNEVESIGPFLERTERVFEKLPYRLDYLFVDDGSTDSTLEVIQKQAQTKRISWISLSRNHGKEIALTAGLEYAAGDCAIPIDVDLQDPPEVIPLMLEKWEEGYEVVFGVRSSRASDTFWKKMTAGFFYKIFNAMSDTYIPPDVGDFRLLDRKVLIALAQLKERNRFMKGLFSWVGYKQASVSFTREKRHAGSTKWNYWKLWNFALDGLVAFGSWPLRVWTYTGLLIVLFSSLYGFFLIGRTLFAGVDVPGYTSTLVVILFMGGVQLLTLGLIGEYVGRIYIEVKQRPLYLIGSQSLNEVRDGE